MFTQTYANTQFGFSNAHKCSDRALDHDVQNKNKHLTPKKIREAILNQKEQEGASYTKKNNKSHLTPKMKNLKLDLVLFRNLGDFVNIFI